MGTGSGRVRVIGREAAGRLLAGEPLERVIDPADPAAWTALDVGVRTLRCSGYEELRILERETAARPETALCHGDGRVRQRALAAVCDDRRLLPLAVIRCADWAAPVRDRARRIVRAALDTDPTATLLALTPLALRLAEREQGTWTAELFTRALDASPDGLLDALRRSPDTRTRRLAGRILLERGRFGVRELARQAVDESDPVMRRLWTDAALAALATRGPDDHAVDVLLGARAGQVRAAGVTALRGAGRADEAALHLTDRSGTVRACARWLLRQDGGDPHHRYRALREDRAGVRPAAVLGLAECGSAEDKALVLGLLEHPSGEVRAAAVSALRHLGSAPVAAVEPLLDDPSPSVVREAARLLVPWADRIPAERLTALTAGGRPAPARRAGFRLLCAQGGLPWLRVAVALLDDEDPRLRRWAGQRIQLLWSPYGAPALPAGDPEVGVLLGRCTALFSDYVLRTMCSRLGIPRP
ncbi:HEAT repeat domain-containing protein [Streptomyces sp. NPDC048603]|uniref:HEAT repeat domain-containing protein n=1 Tax=Streptomyces sp. NPDC048603 TaxID=3365577 RepID=UPI00371BEBD0